MVHQLKHCNLHHHGAHKHYRSLIKLCSQQQTNFTLYDDQRIRNLSHVHSTQPLFSVYAVSWATSMQASLSLTVDLGALLGLHVSKPLRTSNPSVSGNISRRRLHRCMSSSDITWVANDVDALRAHRRSRRVSPSSWEPRPLVIDELHHDADAAKGPGIGLRIVVGLLQQVRGWNNELLLSSKSLSLSLVKGSLAELVRGFQRHTSGPEIDSLRGRILGSRVIKSPRLSHVKVQVRGCLVPGG